MGKDALAAGDLLRVPNGTETGGGEGFEDDEVLGDVLQSFKRSAFISETCEIVRTARIDERYACRQRSEERGDPSVVAQR